jgi:signal transduction histidine kinase
MAEPMRRSHVPLTVLLASLTLTLATTALLWSNARAHDEARLENAVQSATDRIVARMEAYVALLRGGAALFAADEVARAEWQRYVARLRIAALHPGIQGVGYSERIPPDSLDAVAARMRAQGVPGFRLWPDTARAEHHAILYLEPLDRRNQAALGFDMFTEPTRRAAMARARDRAEPALSGRVRLVQEIDEDVQPGFLVYLPVYRGGAIPATLEERRAALQGFVYAPFRADDLFAGIFGTEELPRVAFRVFDGVARDTGDLIFDSRRGQAGGEETASRLSVAVGLELAGHPWTLEFAPTEAFETASRGRLVPAALLAGVLASLLLFGLARGQERARAEAEAARAEAEEANHAKAGFLAAMSHELRTPLNAIGGYVDLLDMGIHGPLNEQQRRALDRIGINQRQLLALIQDILAFARLEAGQVAFDLETLNASEVLESIEPLVEPLAQLRGIRYRVVPCDVPLHFVGDPERVRQILVNIIGNAVKFTPQGGAIRVACSAEGDLVGIAVADTGPGIPPEKQEAIFHPFVQVERRLNRPQEGIGLGLAISRDLATAMGGRLEVESAPGEGSTFTLLLPRADPAPAGAPPPAPEAEQHQGR